MKNRRMRLMAIFAAGVLSVTSMGGIVTAHAEETLSVPAEEADNEYNEQIRDNCTQNTYSCAV